MKLAFVYDHHNARTDWSSRDLEEWLTDIFEAPAIALKPRCTPNIRQHVSNAFSNNGWALDVKIDEALNLTVFAMKSDMAFQLQTGNMSRAPYDLLKLQYLYQCEKINCAAMALPTRDAAAAIGDNIANAERLSNELQLFNRVITVPILLIAFD
jgi:hypothetical protein